MTIDKTPRYNRTVKKIIKAHKLTNEEIIATEELFLSDYKHKSLRFHSITCKKDKNRYSITVPNTQYRILMTIIDDVAYLVALLNHRDYDKNNKDC